MKEIIVKIKFEHGSLIPEEIKAALNRYSRFVVVDEVREVEENKE